MNENKQSALARLVAFAMSVGIVAPSAAQTASGSDKKSASDETELTDVIVTARRAEERLQDVPISITVFSQAELSNRNITDAVDLANMTPSLAVSNGFGTENATFAIRGFSQDTATAPTVAS